MRDPDRESPEPAARRADVAADAGATASGATVESPPSVDPSELPSVLAAIFDASPDPIFVKDLAGRYQMVNPACARALGRPVEEILGRTARDLLGSDAAVLIALERDVLLSGETRTVEGPFAAVRTGRSWIVTVSLWRHREEVRGWIGVGRETSTARSTEQALARSASLLSAAFDSTVDGVLVVDTAGQIVRFNRKFAEMWGISEAVLAAGDDRRAVAAVRDQLIDPEAFEARIRDLYRRPMAESFDILTFRDGRVFERYTKPQMLDGESVGRVCSFRDVTQRHRTELALRASEARYRELFENANDIVYTHDLEGRLLEVNRRGAELSGYTASEVLDLNIRDVLPPEQLGTVLENMSRGVAGEVMPVVELDLVTKQGQRVPLEVNARILREGTVPVAVQGIARDVSERRLAERAQATQAYVEASLARVGRELIGALAGLRLLPRLCELVMEVLLTDGSTSVMISADGTTFSPVANAGRSSELQELMGVLHIPLTAAKPLLARFDHAEVATGTASDYGPTAKALLDSFGVGPWIGMALRRGRELIGLQIGGRSLDGPPFTAGELRLAAGIAQLASMALENARLVEELERASGLKSEFVTTISHELRTPLNIIIGYQDLLAEGTFGELNEQQTDVLTRLQSRSRELLELVDATLDLGRIEGGRLRLQPSEFGLGSLLEEIEAETRELCDDRPVELVFRLDESTTLLRADRTKLKVVLKNLVVNALKFTERGTVEILSAQDATGVRIAVSDTGIGIAEEALGLIFEPFRQVDSSPTSRYGGAGLGLHIVRRLLEVMGGTVEVESRLAEGSTFRVWLPPLADDEAKGD
jgi:PAS domain S-box-containing protein